MTGSVRIDSAEANTLDELITDFVQRNVLRGSVLVTSVARGTNIVVGKDGLHRAQPYYDVQFRGTLETLAGEHEDKTT